MKVKVLLRRRPTPQGSSLREFLLFVGLIALPFLCILAEEELGWLLYYLLG